MMDFDKLSPNINFTYEFCEENVNFVYLNIKLSTLSYLIVGAV